MANTKKTTACNQLDNASRNLRGIAGLPGDAEWAYATLIDVLSSNLRSPGVRDWGDAKAALATIIDNQPERVSVEV